MSAELLNVLYSFQPDAPELKEKLEYHKHAHAFALQLANVAPANFLKGADTQQDVLELLDPSVNTIAYAFALLARISALRSSKSIADSLKPGGAVWTKIVLFLEQGDPVQLRYIGGEWRRLVDHVEQVARAVGTPGLAIAPIREGLLRLDPTTGTFTLTHLSFIRLCLETRSYAAARPILDNYIHSLPSVIPSIIREGLEYSVPAGDHIPSGEYIHTKSGHTEKVTISDIQEYYLLGALAYLGLYEYKKAREFLEHILVVPSSNNTANGLMLEAYKKWVLLGCLVDGAVSTKTTSFAKQYGLSPLKIGSLPRTVNGNAFKQIKAASKAYEALGEAFAQLNNTKKLRAQINAGKDIWAEDGNTGLVQQLIDSQYRVFISRLSKTYSAIPVSNISSQLGGSQQELTDYLEVLVREGYLNARLERSNGTGQGTVLRFFLDPTQGPKAKTEKQQQQALLEQTARTNVLAEQVKGADYRLNLSKEYIEHVKRQSRKATANGGEAMDTSWDDGAMVEEDIMGDMH